jgi:anti-sigma-K factor RskA
MTGSSRCGEDVAPYVLGALPDVDARDFERHMRGCELCRADVETLRPAVEALPLSVERVEPPPELRRRVMAAVDADVKARRAVARAARAPRFSFSFRLLPALAVACVLLVAGIGVGVALTGDDARTVPGQVEPDGASARVELRDGSGKLVVDGMSQPPGDRVYQVWLRSGKGAPRPTDALFEVRGGKAEVAVPGDLSEVDEVLVTHEPRGGSAEPTRAPAIIVQL